MCVTEGVSAWTAGGPPSKQCRLTRQPLWSELSCSTAETVGLHWYFTSAENTHTQTWGPNALTHTHTVTKQECICGRSVLKFLLCSTLHVSSQFPPMFPISTPSFSRSNIKKKLYCSSITVRITVLWFNLSMRRNVTSFIFFWLLSILTILDKIEFQNLSTRIIFQSLL